jgi:HlyD family secretion protein
MAKKRIPRRLLLLAIPVVLFLIATLFRHFGMKAADGQTRYIITQLSRGDIHVTINATGTLEPEEVIDVGAQIAGQIIAFGRDAEGNTIDYGSEVEQGMVLARIDDVLYAAGVDEVKAKIQANRAALLRAKANRKRAEANLTRARRDWERARKLGPSDALSRSKYDNYQSGFEIARAEIAVNQAEIEQVKANLAQSEAELTRARRNFEYCTIKSPVKGVIIDRRVNIGQTVVASLNAPSLFLLAKDLREMEIWVAVNEADIGKIKPGGAVTFTVDAFPGQVFRGEVDKIRLNAGMTQNVVSYTVVVVTNNDNGLLLPYLTANVTFELDQRNNVLTVPKSALRWSPSQAMIPPDLAGTVDLSSESTLWVTSGAYVRPVPVKTGINDGITTEVIGDDLYEGMEVVTGTRVIKKGRGRRPPDSGGPDNPFAPKIPSGPGGGGPGGGPGSGPGR